MESNSLCSLCQNDLGQVTSPPQPQGHAHPRRLEGWMTCVKQKQDPWEVLILGGEEGETGGWVSPVERPRATWLL